MRKAVFVGVNFQMIPATITDGSRRLSNRGKPRLIPQRKGEKKHEHMTEDSIDDYGSIVWLGFYFVCRNKGFAS